MDIRGFEPHRKPVSSYANVKTSVKYNIHNYPLFGDLRIVPFLFAQTGMALHK